MIEVVGAGKRDGRRQVGVQLVGVPVEQREGARHETRGRVVDRGRDRGERRSWQAVRPGSDADRDRSVVRHKDEVDGILGAAVARAGASLGDRHAARDRGVAAERDLGQRAEVADAELADVPGTIGCQERRLRIANLGGDAEHLLIRGQHIAQPDPGRVAAGWVGCERGESEERSGGVLDHRRTVPQAR